MLLSLILGASLALGSAITSHGDKLPEVYGPHQKPFERFYPELCKKAANPEKCLFAQCPDKKKNDCLHKHLKAMGVEATPILHDPLTMQNGPSYEQLVNITHGRSHKKRGWEWPHDSILTPANTPDFWINDDPPSFFNDRELNVKFEWMICDGQYYPEEQMPNKLGTDCNYFAGEVAKWSKLHIPTPGTRALIGICGMEDNFVGLIDTDELDATWFPAYGVLGKTRNGMCAYEMSVGFTSFMIAISIWS